MCGIAGILYADASRQASAACLEKMVDVLHHRGPDAGSAYCSGPVGLGSRRLKVIDLHHGDQPVFNEDKTKAVVFNGEIYNFRELRKELESLGHTFATQCDTEVIVHAYEEYGASCAHHLQGMFCFAVWDARTESLFVARDRLGIKPLYYTWDGRRFLFGSEIKAILQHPDVGKGMDPIGIDHYLTHGYIPAPRTIFEGINKLRPGHSLTISSAGLKDEQYWDLVFSAEPASEEEYVEGLHGHVRDAVKRHVVSDVPVGAFLSGGVDSSAVVAMMSEYMEEPLHTASIGFPGGRHDELPYARQVAEKFGASPMERMVEAPTAELLGRLAWHYDEPFADSSMVPTYSVSELARSRTTVCLSGDGGDEMFAGYHRFKSFVRRVNEGLLSGEAVPYMHRSWLDTTGKKRLYGKSLHTSLDGYDPYDVFRTYYNSADAPDPLSRAMYMEAKTYLVDDILTKVDRASMAHSLEVRVPLLDDQVVAYAARMPSTLKLHNGEGKYVLRKMLADVLPPSVLDRKKVGFSVPLAQWLRSDLKRTFKEYVFHKNSFVGHHLEPRAIKKIWRRHQFGRANHAALLWAILMLEFWGQRFMNGASAADLGADHLEATR